MVERVQNTISRYNMIPGGTRLGVAVSGGADSVFLLHALCEYRPAVLHVNHGLRGSESEGDEEFVAELASALGLPFLSRRMAAPSGNLEQYCRRERLAFFQDMRRFGFVERIATGHTASDQSETVLMRLMRGTGPTGLRGILPLTREGLIRPLLDLSREEVREWLTRRGIRWREDATNESAPFLRNRIRAELLPVLRRWQPRIDESLQRLAEISTAEEDYWEQITAHALYSARTMVGGEAVLDCTVLRGQHPAVVSRVLRAAIRDALGSLDRVEREHIEAIRRLVSASDGEGCCQFPGGQAVRSFQWIRITRARRHTSGFAPQDVLVPGEILTDAFTLRTWIEGSPGVDTAYTQGEESALDWARLVPPLRMRGWEPGDRFRPVRAGKARLLKDWFQSWRIPSWRRRLLPMITDGSGIIWIHGFGAAHEKAADAKTRVRLRVRCDTISSK